MYNHTTMAIDTAIDIYVDVYVYWKNVFHLVITENWGGNSSGSALALISLVPEAK